MLSKILVVIAIVACVVYILNTVMKTLGGAYLFLKHHKKLDDITVTTEVEDEIVTVVDEGKSAGSQK